MKLPIEVPVELLKEETLRSVLESYIVREGTDYGFNELSHEDKIKNLRRRIDRKAAYLVFDPNTESVTFVSAGDWGKAAPLSVENPKR